MYVVHALRPKSTAVGELLPQSQYSLQYIKRNSKFCIKTMKLKAATKIRRQLLTYFYHLYRQCFDAVG